MIWAFDYKSTTFEVAQALRDKMLHGASHRGMVAGHGGLMSMVMDMDNMHMGVRTRMGIWLRRVGMAWMQASCIRVYKLFVHIAK